MDDKTKDWILQFIPTGHRNAITRERLSDVTGMDDRWMRMAIHEARRYIPVLNLSDGQGYFIPDMNDDADRALLIAYVRQEENRLKSIGFALKAARQTCRNCGIDWRYEK